MTPDDTNAVVPPTTPVVGGTTERGDERADLRWIGPPPWRAWKRIVDCRRPEGARAGKLFGVVVDRCGSCGMPDDVLYVVSSESDATTRGAVCGPCLASTGSTALRRAVDHLDHEYRRMLGRIARPGDGS